MSYLHRMPLVPESPVSRGPHQQVDGVFLELPPRKFSGAGPAGVEGCEPFIHSLHAENELACIAGLQGLWQKRDADGLRGPHLELVRKAASRALPSSTESESALAAGSAPVCAGQVREAQSKPPGAPAMT